MCPHFHRGQLPYTALYVFPENLLEICVKVGWSLELVVVTVSHRKGNLNNWSNCSLLDVFLNVTVWCVSAWPRCLCVSVCVLAEFACHLAGGERENKLPPFLGLEVITGLVERRKG